MSAITRSSVTMLRRAPATLRPAVSQITTRQFASGGAPPTGPPGSQGGAGGGARKPKDMNDNGTAKVYEKDGTNPNKNLIYVGIAGLAVAGMYGFFMGNPTKVMQKAEDADMGPQSDKARRYGDDKRDKSQTITHTER
ncbi:hypothetical protein B0H66DRAFT_272666 [Apodospora peruviana]|uniref:Uncharacterized protein n=1 Tax=Apodospora peruviana TaxID=516989 RepID=A0AAE0HZR3_9PEZI|nr:hypothetical protein B0H66DRAFT_272666 [Apodospora peruviana]